MEAEGRQPEQERPGFTEEERMHSQESPGTGEENLRGSKRLGESDTDQLQAEGEGRGALPWVCFLCEVRGLICWEVEGVGT